MRSIHPWPFLPLSFDTPQERSLYLPFILEHLIRAFDTVSSLQEGASHSVQDSSSPQKRSLFFQKLEKLLLFSFKHPFSKQGGAVDHLHFYTEQLTLHSICQDPSALHLTEELAQFLHTFHHKLHSSFSTSLPSWVRSELIQIYETLTSFFTALSGFFQEASTQENVLFALIERRKDLNRFLGPLSVEKLLKELFPQGKSQMRIVLFDGYRKRGFVEFFTKIEPFIDALQWDSECPLSSLETSSSSSRSPASSSR